MRRSLLHSAAQLAAAAAVLALAAALLSPAQAIYIKPDLEKVPVERLVKNLEDLAAKDDKNAQVRFNLARVHAMAYALKTDTAEALKDKPDQGAWFGFEPKYVPFKPVETKDADKEKQAKEHLKKSVEAYKAALKIKPDLLAAQLGLAWTTEQSGDKPAAIKAYREVIDNGWKQEKELRAGRLGGHYITVEAAGYLIPLLDAEKDKEEIQTLKDRSAQLTKLPRPVTPIAVPLKPGLTARDLENPKARVSFDADGSGLKKQWSWVTPDAGWLVYSPGAKVPVTSALQMFGSVGFWLFWDNGYDALRTLDDDGDGELSGKELDGLAIWHDKNGDGVCDPGELQLLSAYGIVAVSCSARQDRSHPDRIFYSPQGIRFRDGSTRPTFDLVLKPR